DQAGGLERAQRLAQRRPADAEALAQLALAGQTVAGPDAPGEDRLPQLLEHVVERTRPACPLRLSGHRTRLAARPFSDSGARPGAACRSPSAAARRRTRPRADACRGR